MSKEEALRILEFTICEVYDQVFYDYDAHDFEKDEYEALNIAIDALKQPTADVVEVVRGEWIRDVYYDYPCICSKCGYQFAYKGAVIRCDDIFHYCPNCGARMVSE